MRVRRSVTGAAPRIWRPPSSANTDTLAYEAGQLISESMTLDSNTYTIQSTYNLTGDLASIEDPTGFQTQYTYLNQPGRPIDTISKQPSGGLATQLADFAYDAAGCQHFRDDFIVPLL